MNAFFLLLVMKLEMHFSILILLELLICSSEFLMIYDKNDFLSWSLLVNFDGYKADSFSD